MNKVILIGNLTRDPELSETNSGIAVCRFGLAVNRQYSSSDGERETDFFQVTAWRGTGENVARYCKKGHKVAVVGSIQMRNYEDREGVKRTAVDIVAQDFGNWAHVREILNKYAGYSIAADEILIMEIDGERYFISDIGMRMLKARELMLAQGFPPDYIIDIESHIGKRYSEAKQIARMGNAVCPPVAEALVRANCAEIASQRVIATMAMLNAVIDESCQRKRQYRRVAQ